MADSTVELPLAPAGTDVPAAPAPAARGRLVRRARGLAWAGLVWHAVEAAVALVAGAAAGSIALIGFGADSVVEGAAGVVVLWRFGAVRNASPGAERRAQQLIAASFAALAVYVTVEALRALAGAEHPGASPVGIGLAAVTLVVMPPLAAAKGRVGRRLGSAATASEGRQNLLCAYLSGALLAGLVGNAALGWWWLDPVVALVIATVAAREARDAWRGEGCDCCAPA